MQHSTAFMEAFKNVTEIDFATRFGPNIQETTSSQKGKSTRTQGCHGKPGRVCFQGGTNPTSSMYFVPNESTLDPDSRSFSKTLQPVRPTRHSMPLRWSKPRKSSEPIKRLGRRTTFVSPEHKLIPRVPRAPKYQSGRGFQATQTTAQFVTGSALYFSK
ncbi:hypothetical protein SISNIDRAFT_31364 [Sistotremastrum niveocremeum HHB9708]|uniref:Uncharacterized protein n=1 Tax=Sistotremastrum niveocremeum HHB9708 TaxID=1314777 RepID=A0A164W6C9_9AGAM|nr:hypothetical protein SISNIDRAFT_31364 [Sistotremastrum niveocremeum HHB9708]